MPPYRGPERGSIPYKCKWVKAGEELITSLPNQRIIHDELAKQDGIYDSFRQYQATEPTKADAGGATVAIQRETGVIEISVWGGSDSLNVPRFDLFDETREDTIARFQEQSPGCVVRKSPNLFERYP